MFASYNHQLPVESVSALLSLACSQLRHECSHGDSRQVSAEACVSLVAIRVSAPIKSNILHEVTRVSTPYSSGLDETLKGSAQGRVILDTTSALPV